MLRILAVLLGTVLLIAAGVAGGAYVYRQPGPLREATAIVVPHGGAEQISEMLAQKGVVGNPLTLRLAALLTRNHGPLHSGELAFPAHASLEDVLTVLRYAKPVQHRLTLPEGLTATQVALLVSGAPALDGEASVPEEGSLLPETYAYELGTARSALEDRAKRAMDRALDQAWTNRTPLSDPLGTKRDALILASIVERETARPDERPRVAAVFLNRLRRGMKLQSDATVLYGASGGSGVLDHGLTRAELDRDNPYNSYRNLGLPPGPICMPGLASLRAVTQPWPGDELYFVADGLGGHLFARTEPEHARNVARWRDIERQRAALPAATGRN